MPGPGQYGNIAALVDLDKYGRMPKWSIAAGLRDQEFKVNLPGPGAHQPNLNHKRTLPRWGFGSEPRLHEIKRSATPGPGAYEVRKGMEGLGTSLAARPSASKRFGNPGPGTYKPNHDPVLDAAAKVSFGASQRAELSMSKAPGPGSYNIDTCLGGNFSVKSCPKYTIKGKYPPDKLENFPGPNVPQSTQFK